MDDLRWHIYRFHNGVDSIGSQTYEDIDSWTPILRQRSDKKIQDSRTSRFLGSVAFNRSMNIQVSDRRLIWVATIQMKYCIQEDAIFEIRMGPIILDSYTYEPIYVCMCVYLCICVYIYVFNGLSMYMYVFGPF